MQPKCISILGVGLLGGSIGLAARSRWAGCRVIGYGHRRSTLDQAVAMGALDEGHERLSPAVDGADLVILCTPVGLFRPLMADLANHLDPKSVVTDVGSTKRSIVKAAEELLPAPERFVASHPMAGSEKRGVQYARADLYDGALCIITPTSHTAPAALETVEDFWRTLGMRTCRLSPSEHDRRLADVSHLPHVLAAALVAMQDKNSFALSGKGFLDMTRIAGGDGALWRDILLDNRDNVRKSIHNLQHQLDRLLTLMDASQHEALREWLDQIAVRRQQIIDARPR
ncbi:MAG TPA: prephenate dehydrogenase [Tepidisphaeraceae bacterium]|jgi:prephenate dehydrogenase|nr:prephenate dehydrogenase [Tepidisphaeraceae bacterium]